MKIELKRVDKVLSLPKERTKDSLIINFSCRKDVVVEVRDSRAVPLNITTKIPKGYVLIIFPSEIAEIKGLVFPRGSLIIDSIEKQEELKFVAYNISNERTAIMGGEIVAYGILVKAEKISIQEGKGR